MIELEKAYLAKYIPENVFSQKNEEIIDIYVPKHAEHPTLRIRKKGSRYEITKKEPIQDAPAKKFRETTIPLTEEEFKSLTEVNGKVVHKVRYFVPYNNHTAEFGIFQGDLKGLVIIDFEFKTEEDMNAFEPPDFCLINIKDAGAKSFLAGGMLCGKSYDDLKERLDAVGYIRVDHD